MKKRSTLALLLVASAAQPAVAATTYYTDQASFNAALAGQVTDYEIDAYDFYLGRGVSVTQDGVTFQAGSEADLYGLGPSDSSNRYGTREYLYVSRTNNRAAITATGSLGRAFGLSYGFYQGTNGITFTVDGASQSVPTPAPAGALRFFGAISDSADIGSVAISGVNQFDVVGFTIGRVQQAENGVPEPATWALMLIGFGLAGASMRSRRRSTTVTYA